MNYDVFDLELIADRLKGMSSILAMPDLADLQNEYLRNALNLLSYQLEQESNQIMKIMENVTRK